MSICSYFCEFFLRTAINLLFEFVYIFLKVRYIRTIRNHNLERSKNVKEDDVDYDSSNFVDRS
jgi:hypothetical protein